MTCIALLLLALPVPQSVPPREQPASGPPRSSTLPWLPVIGQSNVRSGEHDTTNNNRPQIAGSIALDPLHPTHLVATTVDYRLGPAPGVGITYSLDGGLHWTARRLDQLNAAAAVYEGQGISSVASYPNGVFYCAYTDFDQNLAHNRLCVARSLDNGLTWPVVAVIADHPTGLALPFEDRAVIVADSTGGPFDGNVYVANLRIPTSNPPLIQFSRSIDGGLSYSTPVRINDAVDCLNAAADVGPNGEVYVAWRRSGTILLDVSLDGGASFGADRLAATIHPLPDPLPSASFRMQTMPSLAVARHGPDQGALYLVWPDNSGPLGTPDVLFSRSGDGGASWSTPIRVSDDTNGSYQWFPIVAVAPEGTITVAFYDRRQFPNSPRYDVYVAQSTDGGASFSRNRRMNGETSHARNDGFNGTFIGDYMGLAVANRFQIPFWTDCRPSNGNSEGYARVLTWTRP